MYRLFISLAILSLVTACGGTYKPPQSENAATIQGYNDMEPPFDQTWNSAMILEVDGESVGALWSEETKVRIRPGNRKILVDTFSTEARGVKAYFEIALSANPKEHYTVKNTRTGLLMHVTVEDSSGNIIVRQSKEYQGAPKAAPVMVPVYIPAN